MFLLAAWVIQAEPRECSMPAHLSWLAGAAVHVALSRAGRAAHIAYCGQAWTQPALMLARWQRLACMKPAEAA